MSCLCQHSFMCICDCVCVLQFVCVYCQTGSLAGEITAVGTERVHCPSGEKKSEHVFTVKKLHNRTGQNTQLQITHSDTYMRIVHMDTFALKKLRREKHRNSCTHNKTRGNNQISSSLSHTYNVHPNQLNTMIYIHILKNAK